MTIEFILLDLNEAASYLPAVELLSLNELSLLAVRSALQQKINFIAGRYALKKLLRNVCGGDWHDWDIRPLSTGKPMAYFKGKPSHINISISHSKTRVACAAHLSSAIGIDIEDKIPRKDMTKLAQRICTIDEFLWWKNQINRLNAFYEIWTRKEATGKLFGTGLQFSKPFPEDVLLNYPIHDERSICAIVTKNNG